MRRREFIRGAAWVAGGALARDANADERVSCITDVQGIRVGHFTDSRRPTGCTVLIFEKGEAAGVVRYLEERGLGYHVGPVVVPIVPAAILYDLGIGDSKIRPNAESGYKACEAASSGQVAEGNVGAGAGATVGKMFGPKQAMKSGLGTASIRIAKTGI